MKKMIVYLAMSLVMAVLSMPVGAQTAKNDRVAYIRKCYNEAQANAKKSGDNKVTMTDRSMSDGVVSTSTCEFYYVVDVVEGPEIPYSKLSLLRRTEKGGNNSYEEFLYDPEEESLIFYFTSFEYEKGVKCETRAYLGAADDGTMLKISKFTDTKTGKDVSSRYGDALGMPWDEGFLIRFATDMREAFNHFTLRGWD